MVAIQGSNFEKWLEAIKFKIKSMKINDVWTFVDSPEWVRPIGCKWILKWIRGADRKVEIY